MIKVLYREGDVHSTEELAEFSVAGCLASINLTQGDCIPENDDDATALTVQSYDIGGRNDSCRQPSRRDQLVVVCYSNSDGELRTWTGPASCFVG